MPRKRMVDPSMFSSETVATLPHRTRWTWVGLLTYLDDNGRGKDLPALVKATVWPLDDEVAAKDVAIDLDSLEAIGSLCRYACCERGQFHAPTWRDWQKISHPTPSKLCPCPTHEPVDSDIHVRALESLRSRCGAALRNVVKGSSEERSSSDSVGAADLRTAPPGAFDEIKARLAAKKAAGQ